MGLYNDEYISFEKAPAPVYWRSVCLFSTSLASLLLQSINLNYLFLFGVITTGHQKKGQQGHHICSALFTLKDEGVSNSDRKLIFQDSRENERQYSSHSIRTSVSIGLSVLPPCLDRVLSDFGDFVIEFDALLGGCRWFKGPKRWLRHAFHPADHFHQFRLKQIPN
jgi:hypothetical protein